MSRAIRAGAASPKARAKTRSWARAWPRRRCGVSRAPILSQADALAACAKHYCAYGCVTAGRDYAPVDISDRTLHEVHHAAVCRRGVRGRGRDHAGIHRSQRHSDDGESGHAARLAARPPRIRWRRHQRLQRHRRVDPPWRCGGSGRGGGARAESRGGYRHDGRCVSARLADRVGARRGQHRGNRPVGAPRVDPEGAARIIRGSLSARQESRIACGTHAAAAACAANRRAARLSC